MDDDECSSDLCDTDMADWAKDEEDDIPKKSDNEEELDGEGVESSAARTIVPPANILIPVGAAAGVGADGRLGEVVRGAHDGAVLGRARPIMDREVEADGEVDGDIDGDGDDLPQQAALAAQRGVRAAIRWALRGRNLDNNFDRDRDIGGLGERGRREGRGDEEIDERDQIGEMMITGDMVDAEINRDRRIRFDTDRRIRFAEIAARRALLGGMPRNNFDRRSRRREKTCLVRDHLQGEHKKSYFLPQKSLPVNTALCPDEHPRDFIAVLILDIILKETVSVLENIALELLPHYEEKHMLNKSTKKNLNASNKYNDENNNNNKNNSMNRSGNDNESRLKSVAINVIRLILRSSYRKLLIPSVFRILIAHCGIRVKLAVADALQRY